MPHLNRRTFLSAAATAAAPWAPVAAAQPLRIILPFAPGSGTDTVARFLAQPLSDSLGRPVIVENRPGANGVIAVKAVLSSPPNGDTLFMASNTAMVTNPALMKNVPYDSLKDFVPVARMVRYQTTFIVPANSPHKTLRELILAGKLPGSKINYGAGTVSYQLAVERLKQITGMRASPIPYKGAGPAITDLIGGQLDFSMGDLSAVIPLAKGGKLKILAIASADRTGELPDVPTVAESGAPGFELYAWVGAFYPSGVDPKVARQVGDAIDAAMGSSQGRAFLAQTHGQFFPASPDEFRRHIARDIEETRRIAEAANIQLE